MEILPKTAFIQAKSDFSAQLKFVAKNSLGSQDAAKYFDQATGVLEVPLHIRVADQVRIFICCDARVFKRDLSTNQHLQVQQENPDEIRYGFYLSLN